MYACTREENIKQIKNRNLSQGTTRIWKESTILNYKFAL